MFGMKSAGSKDKKRIQMGVEEFAALKNLGSEIMWSHFFRWVGQMKM